MANHLTIDELAELCAMSPRQVTRLCNENAVPVYNGRIDKALFVKTVTAAGHRLPLMADEDAHELATT